MMERRRVAYLALRFGMLAVALIAVALYAVRTFAPLGRDDAIALLVCLFLFVALLRINVPLFSGAYLRRRHLEPGRLTLELPVALAVFVIYGPVAAAAINLLGYPLAIPSDGRSRVLRRVLDGGTEAFLWIALGALRTEILPQAPELTLSSFGMFLAFYTFGIFAFLFFVTLPLRALNAQSLLVIRLWRKYTRDTRLFVYVIVTVAWGYVAILIWMRAGMTLGLVSFAPLPFLASALRELHNHHLELHRLRLARDAVQAMLRTRDPLPQMNSLLASLHTPAAEETLQIYAALSADERLSPLATIGPIPDSAQLEDVRRAIVELQHGDKPSTAQRSRTHALNAYAVRTPDERLLGALIVHRPARTASLLPARRFAQAAAELAPLLRDFRSIAATQNAAAVDALTGLPNRRTIMEFLRERIEYVSIGNPCAVLLIDIDHFKSINDTMGHQAGDQCLRTVGALIARNIRGMDRAGRIGGEEFVILMPDTTSEMARSVGERLRVAIESAEVRRADGEPVTASIGIAVASVSDTVDSLLARADRALYQAKRQGRNRVIEISA
jgi:diguanylate cyclase (GGDEF)-like protein